MISRATGSKLRAIVGVALTCMTVTAHAAAAGQVQDAMIFGVVTDDTGAVLPGVTVTVSGPSLQSKEMTSVTNGKGEYRVTPLPLGTYTVDIVLQGFQARRYDGIRLTAGFAAKVDSVLAVGAVAESVTVSGVSPVVDVKTTTAGTQVTREVLESVPSQPQWGDEPPDARCGNAHADGQRAAARHGPTVRGVRPDQQRVDHRRWRGDHRTVLGRERPEQ